jgi:predicted nucleic acid-binding protein
VRYWDSSALLPLLIQEPTTSVIQALVVSDRELLTWWATRVEAASALARLAREGALDAGTHQATLARLSYLAQGWAEVLPSDAVRDQAGRLLRLHPLRAADALHLAAALVASEHQAATLPFVTLDQRLAAAAQREGFPVLP